MPANTANGLPYPLGTDPIAQGDDSIMALATALDKRIPAKLAGAQAVAVAAVNNGGNANVNVVYPVGLFAVAPVLLYSLTNNRLTPAVIANTKDGATIQVANFSGANAAVSALSWVAIQLPV